MITRKGLGIFRKTETEREVEANVSANSSSAINYIYLKISQVLTAKKGCKKNQQPVYLVYNV